MNLKEIRTKRGLTQVEVAKKLGVAQVTYCNYELGNREPDISTLIKLADLFNVTIDELFGYKPLKEKEVKPVSKEERFIIENLKHLNKRELNKIKGYISHCLELHTEDEKIN